MDAPALVEIALRSFKAGGRSFDPADRVEALSLPDMTERLARQMREQGYLAPLSRKTYEDAIAHRPPDTIGRGFTREELIARGILDKPEAKAEAPAKAPKPPKLAPVAFDDPGPGKDEVVEHAGQLFALRYREVGKPNMTGHPIRRYSVFNADGAVISPKEFMGRGAAIRFIESLAPAEEAPESTDS